MQALLYNIDMRNARENLKNNPKQIPAKTQLADNNHFPAVRGIN